MAFPGQPKPSNLLINAGVITTGGTPVLFGATRGGITFDPGKEMRYPEFDGSYAEIVGLHRPSGWRARFSGRVIEATAGFLAKLEAGSATVVAGTPAVSTITPAPAGVMLVEGDYLEEPTLHYRNQAGGLTRVVFQWGLVTTYRVSGEHNNEGIFEFEMVACVADDADLEEPPYVWEVEAAP